MGTWDSSHDDKTIENAFRIGLRLRFACRVPSEFFKLRVRRASVRVCESARVRRARVRRARSELCVCVVSHFHLEKRHANQDNFCNI